jgi:hypothetical protein
LRCCTNGTKDYGISTCFLPHTTYLAKETTTASLRAQSFIRQRRRLHLHPCGAFGQLHMHGKGGSQMTWWCGWANGRGRRKERSVPTGVHERAGARRSQVGWVARGQVTVADPAFFGVSDTVVRRNGAVGLISWRTYPQCQVSIRSKYRWRLQWHEHL